MDNTEKAKKIVLSKPFNDASSQDYAYKCAMEMAEWKDEQMKQTLIDFMHYLDKRGFFRDDLCCDIEHQVDTFIELRNREE